MENGDEWINEGRDGMNRMTKFNYIKTNFFTATVDFFSMSKFV